MAFSPSATPLVVHAMVDGRTQWSLVECWQKNSQKTDRRWVVCKLAMLKTARAQAIYKIQAPYPQSPAKQFVFVL
jgi:hypothetical protein